jgi:PHP family Zn ribbon phosphoesterase
MIPYKSLVPLDQIIADALDMGVATKGVQKKYSELINKLGNEFNILLNASQGEIESASLPEIAEGVMRVREGKLKIEPGYDGEYGVVKIFDEKERKGFSKQKSLF